MGDGGRGNRVSEAHGIDGALRITMLDPEYVSKAVCLCGQTFSATNFTIIDANEDALGLLRAHVREVQ